MIGQKGNLEEMPRISDSTYLKGSTLSLSEPTHVYPDVCVCVC